MMGDPLLVRITEIRFKLAHVKACALSFLDCGAWLTHDTNIPARRGSGKLISKQTLYQAELHHDRARRAIGFPPSHNEMRQDATQNSLELGTWILFCSLNPPPRRAAH